MSLDYHLKIQGDLIADSREASFSLQKAAQVRLNNLSLVKNHPCIVSNPKRIELLEQRLELQCSIGSSEGIRKSSALEKDLAEMDKLSPLLFQVIAMYKENETTKRRSTKDSINSILLTVFGITPPNSGKFSSKSEWLLLLQQQDKGQGQSWEDGWPSCCYSEQCKYTLAISTMPTSKGEYDDRCIAIGNIFGGSPST